jgi:peptidoglycan/xylan/chitin deacetylase (PgdA/CDA1 family)
MGDWAIRRNSWRSKRHRLSSFCARWGITRVLEKLPRRDCLIVLNYHRIGSSEETPGDPGVYSATPEDFDQQVAWIKRHFRVATLAEAVAFSEGRTSFRNSAVLLTFDDGYKDNYDHAYRVLKDHGVQGTFFLCTSFFGSDRLPWWDQIAYMLKNAPRKELTLVYPEHMAIDLRADAGEALGRLLGVYKSNRGMDKARFLLAISEATGVPNPPRLGRTFLDRAEASRMVADGMAIGSHTVSHEVLSHLAPERQFEELTDSKRVLEESLGVTIDALAYPVGSRSSFDRHTEEALRRAGYRVAFSYYGGVNRPRLTRPFDLRRESVGVESDGPYFRLHTIAAALLAKALH